jgi:hypothetical protein
VGHMTTWLGNVIPEMLCATHDGLVHKRALQ